MNNIEIFDMTLQDFDEIKDILISDFDDFWTPEVLKSEIIGENKKYIIAKYEKEIVGFCGIMINPPDIEIMNIVVKKNSRQKGIGTALLDKVIEISQKLNSDKIFLEVNEKNVGAIKLYKNAGFKQIGIRKKYYDNKYDAINFARLFKGCNIIMSKK